ncbi:MAG: cupin domain-containing protein [Candidatus Micrarchaeota archaeon]
MSKNLANIYGSISYSKGGITSKELVRSPSLDVTLFCMAKGTALSEHTSTKEAVILVLEGKGTFKLGAKRVAMAPGVFIHMKSNQVHALKVSENTSFLLYLTGFHLI